MQDRWASLLANAANPKTQFDLCATFSQILNQLSSYEVAILDFMYEKFLDKANNDRKYVDKSYLLKIKFEEKVISHLVFDNLIRLRLLEEEIPKLDYFSREFEVDFNRERSGKQNLQIQPSNNVRLSEFAVEFIKQTKF